MGGAAGHMMHPFQCPDVKTGNDLLALFEEAKNKVGSVKLDGTNVSFTEFGTLTTGSAVGAYTMDVSGGLMRLRVTPASASSSTFKVKYTTIKV